MAVLGSMNFPVRIRVGDGEEHVIGLITMDLVAGEDRPSVGREDVAAFLRAAADAYEHGDTVPGRAGG